MAAMSELAQFHITTVKHSPGKGHPTQPAVVLLPGMKEDAMVSPIFKYAVGLCEEFGLEYIIVKDEAMMGLGSPDAVESLRFPHLINLVQEAVNATRSPSTINLAHSLAVWPAIHVAMKSEKVKGNLFLGPAYDDILTEQYQMAMVSLKFKAEQGDDVARGKLEKMVKCEFVEVEVEGYPFPFHMKFVASSLPYKLNMYGDGELPVPQPTTIMHGSQDRRVKVANSRALKEKLPNATSNFVEIGEEGHNFDSPVGFEAIRHELVKLVDKVTKNWAGETYMEGTFSQIMFGDLPANQWIVHEMADDGTGRSETKFRIKNKSTGKVYKTKAAALESISGRSE